MSSMSLAVLAEKITTPAFLTATQKWELARSTALWVGSLAHLIFLQIKSDELILTSFVDFLNWWCRFCWELLKRSNKKRDWRKEITSVEPPLCVGNICPQKVTTPTLSLIFASLYSHIFLKQYKNFIHFQVTADQHAQYLLKLKDHESIIKLALTVSSSEGAVVIA